MNYTLQIPKQANHIVKKLTNPLAKTTANATNY